MKNIIKGLSESKRAEIKDIIEVSAEAVYLLGFADGQSSTVEDTAVESFEHEGKLLRKVDRIACEGDIVIFTQLQADSTNSVTAGKKYEVITAFNEPRFISDSNGKFRVYEKSYKRTLETVAVFEAVAHEVDKPAPLTANQQRAELIQRAREFVVIHQRDLPGDDCRIYGNKTCRSDFYETEFIIKNNKVTALIHLLNASRKRVQPLIPNRVGRAECSLGDVFNEWIGKAIALAKALEIDIPQEFIDAVQPDYAVGQVIKFTLLDGTTVIETINKLNGMKLYSGDHGKYILSNRASVYNDVDTPIILDDTNAEYLAGE